MRYRKQGNIWRYFFPATKLLVAGWILLIIALLLMYLKNVSKFNVFGTNTILKISTFVCVVMAVLLIFVSFILYLCTNEEKKITYRIKKGLYDPRYGNPLGFKDGEVLPCIKCKRRTATMYELTISITTCTAEKLERLPPVISALLSGKYRRYAVTKCETDIAYNTVTYQIIDVLEDKSLIVSFPSGLRSQDKTKIPIDKETCIDLTVTGSILVAGKTRSGKTTGIIAMLLTVLQHGRDEYLSNIMIVDPKQAELSRLPYVVTLDEDGEARTILEQMHNYEKTIKCRQEVLNKRSDDKGDAVKWWERGECDKCIECVKCELRSECTESSMHPSFLFLDEYVSLRSVFPPRASKEDGGYNLANFDNTLKRIVTMGASAGCFVIISIAEASVGEGGLPSMLKSAMTTKILFKPTVEEARLIWNSDQLQTLNTGRTYGAGDCWMSSTDGIHDMPGYLHFPQMQFEVYRELGRLLTEYYAPRD